MFRVYDPKRAIWISIIIFILLASSMSFAQIPREAEFHNRLGNEYCDKGEFDKAVQEYEEAIKIHPEYTDAYYNIGVTYYHDLKDYQKAADYFQKFLEFESASPDAQQIKKWISTIESDHGIKPRPISFAKKAEPVKEVAEPARPAPPPPTEIPKKVAITPPAPPITRPPAPLPVPVPQKEPAKPQMPEKESSEELFKNALAFKNRGNQYCREGKYQMGVREYLKAIELRPDYTDALYNLAKTYDFDLNESEKAIQYYEEFLKYEPSNTRDARQVQTWLMKAKIDLASREKKPPQEVPKQEAVIQKPALPKTKAKYDSKPFTKGLLEKPLAVASLPKEPSVTETPVTILPPAPIDIPTPEPSPLSPAGESAILKSYIPKELKSVRNSIKLRAQMKNELLDIFKSKDALQNEKLAQLFLTKIKQETLSNGFEMAQIEVPGDLIANIDKVYILSHSDRINLNNEKGQLLRSPQTPQNKKRLQDINQILEDGYEIRP